MIFQRLFVGDVMDALKRIPDESVDCCITSPPYWGLRDYGTGSWEGGSSECNHEETPFEKTRNKSNDHIRHAYQEICLKCGAKRIDKQIGLEKTPEEYVQKMVLVFRDVRRVLKKEGTLWLNLGDTYAGSRCGAKDSRTPSSVSISRPKLYDVTRPQSDVPKGLKAKDLIGIPWRVAFALQADGWYLRQDIIWHKPNAMPESVMDRCTKAHEYVFLMAKSGSYYFDNEGMKEAFCELGANGKRGVAPRDMPNPRSVWTVRTMPLREPHFAAFPPHLIGPMVRAGTSEKGACPKCGRPWERILGHAGGNNLGWRPTCECGLEPVPAVVLDPFMGAGTTFLVTNNLGRSCIGIELNPKYVEIMERRLRWNNRLIRTHEIITLPSCSK